MHGVPPSDIFLLYMRSKGLYPRAPIKPIIRELEHNRVHNIPPTPTNNYNLGLIAIKGRLYSIEFVIFVNKSFIVVLYK
jgi:hypothetical protein